MAKTRCYARCHLTMAEYGLYQYACEVSHKSGKFYCSGPKAAKEFADTGKNAIYRVAKQLVTADWFEVLTLPHRNPTTGTYLPLVVRPVPHDEWKRKHPEAICHPVETMTEIGNGSMTESGKGTMTDFESSMTDFDATHDRNREQVLEVSSEIRESTGDEKDARSQENTSQAEEESRGGNGNQEDSSFPTRLSKESEASARPVPKEKAVSPSVNPELVSDFAAFLYGVGRKSGVMQAFSGANLDSLGTLLRKFSTDEITNAWHEHLEGCTDEFLRRQAVSTFCRGGCQTIVLAQQRLANEELERRKGREKAERERRLRSLIDQQARRVLQQHEADVRKEWTGWFDAHDDNKDFVPSHEAAFELYKARDEQESACKRGASWAEREPLDRRVNALERSALVELIADPRIIAAAEAEFNGASC